MNNPVGADLVQTLIREAGIRSFEALLLNPIVKGMKLKHLQIFLKSLVDKDTLQVICDKMNTYCKEELPKETQGISRKWWKEGICYQIYPRSFFDSNDDGIGDIQGIISKLDYLKDLGVDILWLSPIYDSPNDDNGYDIRDYQKVMREFGTMEDMEKLIDTLHSKDMRLIMDLVINHTSDEHYWFQEAKKGKDNPYHDYYIWKSGEEEKPPNNWTSLFEGSAWEYDKSLNQYYLHLFSKKQVDLNWDNPKLRQDIYAMVNWWLDKGIDGFRLDVINFISKEETLPQGNVTVGKITGFTGIEHYVYGPRVHKYIQELNKCTFSNYDVMTVGECQGVGPYMGQYFTHEQRGELNMIFDFGHMVPPGKSKWDDYAYKLSDLKVSLLKKQESSHNACWPTVFFENHDSPRFIERLYGSENYYEEQSKLIALLQMTLQGTPFIYQGQEIGMKNPTFHSIDEFKDVESWKKYEELKKSSLTQEDIVQILNRGSRDNARVPLSWDRSMFAGFSSCKPWLKVCDDYKDRNVEKSLKDPESILIFYKELIALRKIEKSLVYGQFQYIKTRKEFFVYKRCLDNNELMILCNLSNKTKKLPLNLKESELLVSTYRNQEKRLLQPYEACIYRV